MEILVVRKWIFRFFSGAFSAILNEVKYARIRLTSLFLHFLNDVRCFFSPGRDQLLGRVGQENIGPCISFRISPLHEFWVARLDSSI